MPTALEGPAVASSRPQLWRVTDRASALALLEEKFDWIPEQPSRRPGETRDGDTPA